MFDMGAQWVKGTDATREWFCLPIQVKGLPADAEYVPVSCTLDFRNLLESLGVRGAVDERSMRLFYQDDHRESIEIPFQYCSANQDRFPERRLGPDTPTTVSWVADWGASDVPRSVGAGGTLTWCAHGGGDGTNQYALFAGVPRTGRFVQVPFPPQNLRWFDNNGISSRVGHFPRMQIRPQWPLHGYLDMVRDGSVFTSYHTGPVSDLAYLTTESAFRRFAVGSSTGYSPRRPYFYPVNGPDGIGLTEIGKPHDPTGSHAHHYSLWIAHAQVDGADFWSERGGAIVHEAFESLEDGPIYSRIVQRTGWVNVDGRKLLEERRRITAYACPDDYRLLDIELELSPAGGIPVELGRTPFGFLSARVAQSMNVFDGSGVITNASGFQNEQAAHHRRAPWIDQSGPTAPDRWGGVALFDHPDNSNHPTGWHCRNDGWAGSSFNFDSPWRIQPGSPLRLKYRVHLHRHDWIDGGVERRYREYACRPKVILGHLSQV